MAVPATMATWPDFLPSPTLAFLTQAAAHFGARPLHLRDCKDNWVCPTCKKEYEPVKNVLINLPEYECSACHTRNPTDYAWSITDITFNHVELDFMVYDQGPTGHCSIYSVAAAMECGYRIRGALSGFTHCFTLDPPEFVNIYRTVMNHEYDQMPSTKMYLGIDPAPVVLQVVRDHGFPLKRGILEQGVIRKQKIKGFFKVDVSDVPYMTRLLANGMPLIACLGVGTLFQFLSVGQPYAAPALGDEHALHSVVLIGSGTAERNGQTETFFVVRNSHGIKAHAKYHTQKYGADFVVWASDVHTAWGFFL